MTIDISEFELPQGGGGLPRPPLIVQPPLRLVPGKSVRSAPLNAATRLVRIAISRDFRIRVYPVPDVGEDQNVAAHDGSDGLSEFFGAGEHIIGIAYNDGQVRLAVTLADMTAATAPRFTTPPSIAQNDDQMVLTDGAVSSGSIVATHWYVRAADGCGEGSPIPGETSATLDLAPELDGVAIGARQIAANIAGESVTSFSDWVPVDLPERPRQQSHAFSPDIGGPAGAALFAQPGWSASGNDAFTMRMDGAGALYADVSSGGSTAGHANLYDPGEGEVTVMFRTVGNGAGFADAIYAVAARDFGNGMFLRVRTAAGDIWTCHWFARTNGSDRQLGGDINFTVSQSTLDATLVYNSATKMLTLNDRAPVDVMAELGRAARDAAAAGGADVETADTAGLAAAQAAIGTCFGFGGRNYELSGEPRTRELSIFKGLGELVSLAVPGISADGSVPVAFTWDVDGLAPTKLQYQTRRSLGGNAIAVDWTTADDTVVDADGTGRFTVGSHPAGTYRVHARFLNDTALTRSAPNDTLFDVGPAPFELGYGVTGTGNYYRFDQYDSDWSRSAEVRGPDHPDTPNVILIPFKDIDGQSVLRTDPGFQMTPIGGTQTSNLTVSSDSSGAFHSIDVLGNALPLGNDARGLRFVSSPPGRTPTILGLTRAGIDIAAQPLNPHYAARHAGQYENGVHGRGARNLDWGAANSPLPHPLYRTATNIHGLQGPRLSSQAQYIAQEHNANPTLFNNFGLVEPVDGTDDYYAARALIWRDNLPPGLRLMVEFGNERPWNYARQRCWIEGIKHGLYADGGAAYPNVVIPTDEYWAVAPAMPAGTPVVADKFFAHLYLSKVPISAGTAFPPKPSQNHSGSDANFQLIADFDRINRFGAHRWLGMRFAQILAIWRDVFGLPAFQTRVFPALYGQVNDNVRALDTQRNMSDLDDWLHHLGNSAYGYDNLDYTAASGLTVDIVHAAFMHNIHHAHPSLSDIRGGGRSIVDRVSMLSAEVRAEGKVPAWYEASPFHHSRNNVHASGHYRSLINEYEADSRIAVLEEEFIRTVRPIARGPMFFYKRYESGFNGDRGVFGFGGWGAQQRLGASPPRWQGHLAGLTP